MLTKCLIKHSEYHDSVALMETARELTQQPGIDDAAVVMATEANLALLDEAGLLVPDIVGATANDLIIVVRAERQVAADRALRAAEIHLTRQPVASRVGAAFQPRTIRSALRATPNANLAVISVAGRYAADEAWVALQNGLHVLLFSDNVSIEDEVALKQYASSHGLLLMGPDCGTAIVNGVALGFANALPRGPVGIVAASGTGLQEVSTLLAGMGLGITQGIGTGGRDLKEQVGGLTMLQGIRALQADPHTEVLVLISKPPSPAIVERVLAQASQGNKPVVVCFLGGDPAPIQAAGVAPARTLQEAAYLASAQIGAPPAANVIEQETKRLRAQARKVKSLLRPEQKYLRGLFSGGTLAVEALVVWQDTGLANVYSNVPLDPRLKLQDATRSTGHCAVDLGEDEFTVGRPHPMLDNDLRIRRMLQEAADPNTALILLDVVLGYGVHPNPAGDLGPAIRDARQLARDAGRELVVIASVTGTEADPQVRSRQVQTLEDAGAIVVSCNAAAARLASFVVDGKDIS